MGERRKDMEKLKAKHDHLFTKLLKVGIFALVLLLPFFVFMPTAFYYGFNEHATEVQGGRNQITLKQEIENGKPILEQGQYSMIVPTWTLDNCYIEDGEPYYIATDGGDNPTLNIKTSNLEWTQNDKLYFCSTFQIDEQVNYNVELFINQNKVANIEWSSTNEYKYNNIITMSYSDYSTSIDLTLEDSAYITIKNIQLFNLTQIFGSGNEPSAEDFANIIGDNYYEYGQEYTITLNSNWSITDNMSLAWETTWKTPLFNWTENTPFKASIQGFTQLFGINQESGIDNLLAYIMTISCIYVVIDIVLGLFTWITHTIGER